MQQNMKFKFFTENIQYVALINKVNLVYNQIYFPEEQHIKFFSILILKIQCNQMSATETDILINFLPQLDVISSHFISFIPFVSMATGNICIS